MNRFVIFHLMLLLGSGFTDVTQAIHGVTQEFLITNAITMFIFAILALLSWRDKS